MGKHTNRDSQWFRDAMIRAIRTFAQTMLSGITVGKMISEINWLAFLSVALVATLYSILTSVVTGLPESSNDGTVYITDTNDLTKVVFEAASDPYDWAKQSSIRLKVDTSGAIPKGIVVNSNLE